MEEYFSKMEKYFPKRKNIFPTWKNIFHFGRILSIWVILNKDKPFSTFIVHLKLWFDGSALV
jgi:hypothetical protein